MLLLITIISLSLNNLYYWFVDIGLDQQFNQIHLLYLPWNILFPITFYIYVHNYIGDEIHKNTMLGYFAPFLVSSLLHIFINIFYDTHSSDSYPFWIDVFYIGEEYIAFIIAITVGIISYRKLKRVKKESTKINVEWLKILLRAGLMLCLLWLAMYTASIKFKIEGLKLYYPIWLGISIMFYWIGYRGLYQFKLAKDRKAISSLLNEIKSSVELAEINNSKLEKYTKETPLFRELIGLIETKHIYRKQDLTLDSIAKTLKTNRSTLSKLINQVTEKKFTDFINEYRIKEAKQILNNSESNKYKISAIGYEVGFNHVSTFYSIFKKHTGVTPAKYRESIELNKVSL